MEKTILNEYAKLKLQASEIEKRLDELKPSVIEELSNLDISTYETSLGKFSINKRKVYTYPEYIIKAKEEVKVLEKQAISNEEATYEEVQSLVFTGIKI